MVVGGLLVVISEVVARLYMPAHRLHVMLEDCQRHAEAVAQSLMRRSASSAPQAETKLLHAATVSWDRPLVSPCIGSPLTVPARPA